jgi:hypothetical protein
MKTGHIPWSFDALFLPRGGGPEAAKSRRSDSMNALAIVHPTLDDLKAFGLGKSMTAASAEMIELHLGTCKDCFREGADVSEDQFLGKLRAKSPDATPTPDGSVGGIAHSITRPSDKTPYLATQANAIPIELSNYPDYEVIRELGRGGMGVVYLATNTLMGRDEVLKVMGSAVMNRPEAADRFRREIQFAARLAHPNIVRAYSARNLAKCSCWQWSMFKAKTSMPS